MIVDDRKGKRMPKVVEKNHLQEQVSRKVKYLFRSRNKAKLPVLARNDIFSTSFYCSKLTPDHP
jgi:hypothetical protein